MRVHPRRGRRAGLARWQGRVSAISHTRPNHSALKLFSAISPPLGRVSSRGLRAAIALSRRGLAGVRIRPRCGRRAALVSWQGRVSAVSHMPRTSSHEPQYQYTVLFVTAVGPPAVLASLKPLNNTVQLPLHVPCIVSNNYFVYGFWNWVIYYKNTLFKYIPAPIRPYVPAVLYTMVGCACREKLRMTKGVVVFVPYRTAIRSGLTYIILGAIRTYLQY